MKAAARKSRRLFYWRPQGDSNPRYRRERAMSWASRRWGRNLFGGARRDRTVDLLHAMQALSQLSYGPTRGAATYGHDSSMSSKQKRLRHIATISPQRTGSPYFRFTSSPVSASSDTLKYVFPHVLLAPSKGHTRREAGTQSFRSEAPRGHR